MSERVQFRVGEVEVDGVNMPAVFQEEMESQEKVKDIEHWGYKHIGAVVVKGDRLRSVQGGVALRKGWKLATMAEIKAHFVDAEMVGDDKMTEEIVGRKFDALVVK